MGSVLRVLLAVAAPCVAMASACGLDSSGTGNPATSDAGAGAGGAHSIDTGSCFVGAKACPNEKGELACLSTSDPQTGCQSSTSCAPCELPNAAAACKAQLGCVIGGCNAEWSDCNGTASDGCEASLSKDGSNCGSCGLNCITQNGPGWLCDKGQCVENQCQPKTTANCDGDPTTGCEIDLVGDPANCGFCGNVCQLPHAKSGCAATPSGNPVASCVVIDCDPGWANCDGNHANGCESSAGTDPSTCGGCGKKCSSVNGVAGCVNGVCGILCNPGFGNCDGNVDNGCETDLSSHVSHCGACNNGCSSANGTPTCSSGKCTTGGCNGGFEDCDGNPNNGCETDTTSSPDHCGGCGNACPTVTNGTAACTGGVCGATCSPGFDDCGSGTTCYDTTTDAEHCGTSCAKCPAPTGGSPACSGGTCQITCSGGLSPCGGSCVDLSSSNANCGTCGKVCQPPAGGSVQCTSGQCVATCSPPLISCGGKCVDAQSDEGNCGGCNKYCKFLQYCQAGVCKCPGGLKECSVTCAECCGGGDCSSNKCCFGFCC